MEKTEFIFKQSTIEIINGHIKTVHSIIQNNLNEIDHLCNAAIERIIDGGKILFMGNGGSAADSQHLAAEFVGKFNKNRNSLPAIALTTDTSVITSIANDYEYRHIFSRQIAGLCTDRDLVIGISTSGNSKNIVEAIAEAKNKKALTVGFLGKGGGKLKEVVDLPIVIDSNVVARIQECHILIGHILCNACDEYFTKNFHRK